MPAKALPFSERLLRLEAAINAQSKELQEMRLFCLDIHPEYSKRIIDSMQEMEQKVFQNVSNFEGRLEEINQTVKKLVTKSANDCFALVNEALSSKIAGLDSRLIGLNKRHVEIDKELTSTLARLNEFSESVEKTLDNANSKALHALSETIQSTVSSLVEEKLNCSGTTMKSQQERGRSRESFQKSQNVLMTRARSISSERELVGLIREARSIAADRAIAETQ
jgi:hypothetical protein